MIATSLAIYPGFAAGSAGTSGQPRYKFVVITHAAAAPFFVPVRKGTEDAAKLVGADVTYTGPPGSISRSRLMGNQILKYVPGGGHVLLCIHTAGAENLEARQR